MIMENNTNINNSIEELEALLKKYDKLVQRGLEFPTLVYKYDEAHRRLQQLKQLRAMI